MPGDALFPNVPGVSREVELSAAAVLTVPMLGALVGLNGFTLTVGALEAAQYGVVTVSGPGTLAGLVEKELAEGEAVQLVVRAGTVSLLSGGGAEADEGFVLVQVPEEFANS